MIKMYAIPNCSTVKKARTWLDENGIKYEFHDYKKLGTPVDEIDDWLNALGWELLINRRGTTWRNLTDEQKEAINNPESAKAAMLDNASIIKRPLMVKGGKALTVGFDEDEWKELFL